MSTHPVHVCLLTPPHAEHDWVYTSSGGGHMMDTWDASGLERDQKWWHCPGVAGVTTPEVVDDDPVPTVDEMREEYARNYAASRDPFPYQSDIIKGRERFDRFLRQVQRMTWDHGFGNGVADQSRWQQTGIPDGNIRNPYLEE